MSRVKFTTTIEGDLLEKAREAAQAGGFEGVNTVIEEALRIYFANCTAEVWEKELQGGWVKKLVVRPGKVTFESIRCRKVKTSFNPTQFTSEALERRGWHQVWRMKKA